jgi:NTE family protein
MFKIGLTLSGGGARSIAHLGVLQGLEDLGIRPDAVAGASAGAVLGALYAAGRSPRQILEAVKTSVSSGLLNKLFSGSGLFTAEGLLQFFKATGLPDQFEDLSLPLWVSATDLRNCRALTFSEGDLHKILLASCAVPGVFSPVHYRDHDLADGGILNNLPVREIRPLCETLIGSNVNKIHVSAIKTMSRLRVLERCFHLVIAEQVAVSATFCDHYLEPELGRYPMFELKYPDQIFRAGYRAVMQHEKEFRRLL